MRKRSIGFTLVEIMIVVAIIGLLAAIAVPSFLKARDTARRTSCINNLRQIDGAKDQYAIEYGGVSTSVFSEAQVGEYIKDMAKCFCPVQVSTARTFTISYTIGPLTSDPVCALATGGSETLSNHAIAYSGK